MTQAIDKLGLIELLEPPLLALGYELVDLEAHAGRHGLLRVYIDREPAVTLADCELVSEQIGAFLDVENPLSSSYVLEVSSPGLDRRLRTVKHFERFTDELIKVELEQPQEDRRKFRGRLMGIDGGVIALDVDGVTWHFDVADIAVARLVSD